MAYLMKTLGISHAVVICYPTVVALKDFQQKNLTDFVDPNIMGLGVTN
jgi:hypothetical protein